MLLVEGVELLDYHDPVDHAGQAEEEIAGQRIGQPQLQEGGVGEDLARVGVGNAARYDAQARAARLDAVEVALLRPGRDVLEPLLDLPVHPPSVDR
ncbi:MAG: hypothetical protein M5U22_13340 [Thermoleophilia bacterium]|nr:hypothetical protein [Thermoleophilia bacterium]